MKDTITKIISWAHERDLLNKGTRYAQVKKVKEEVEELILAFEENDVAEVKDAIADITITLVVLSQLYGINFEKNLKKVADEVTQRKGKMVNGEFCKDC